MRPRNNSDDTSTSKQKTAQPPYQSTFISLATLTDEMTKAQQQAAIDAKKKAEREERRIKTDEANRLERLRKQKIEADKKAKQEAHAKRIAEAKRTAQENAKKRAQENHEKEQARLKEEWKPVLQKTRSELAQLLHPQVNTQPQAQTAIQNDNNNQLTQTTGLLFFPRPSRENAVVRPAKNTGCCAGFFATLKSCWARLFSCGTSSRTVVRPEATQVSPAQSRVAGIGPMRNVME